MARNRKSQSAAIRFGPALKALLLCLLIGGSGVGYVWQKEQLSKLGTEIQRKESRRNYLRKQNEGLRKQLANLRSPQFLEARIKEANLGLVRPQVGQILRLVEPMADATPRPREPQFAARTEPKVLEP
jgi:hypothetical protein